MKIFISYPDKNVLFAQKIKEQCIGWGYDDTFIAADEGHKLVHPLEWLDGIISEIERRDVFVLCLAKSSLTARIQQMEWRHVLVGGIPEKCIIVHEGDWNPAYEEAFKCVRNYQGFRHDDEKQVESFKTAISAKPPEEERFHLLQQSVIEAGTQLLLRYSGQFIFGRPRVLDERKNFATTLDREIQNQIIREIRGKFPGDGIIAEEETEKGVGPESKTGFVWTVDPLDGTLNFMGGDDRYCCGVGVLRNGLPFMGAIFVPSRMELYTGGVGREAKCHSLSNGTMRIIHTSSQVEKLSDCHVLSHINSEPPRLEICFRNNLPKKLHLAVRRVWMWGSGLLAGISVAQGCHHVFLQRVTYPYDLVPYLPIVQSAGGIWRTIPRDSSLCWDPSSRDVGIVVTCNEKIMKEIATRFPELGL